jgi:hypothetical protein
MPRFQSQYNVHEYGHRTNRPGQPERDGQNRNLEQDSQNRIASRTARTSQPEQDSQGQIEQDRQ